MAFASDIVNAFTASFHFCHCTNSNAQTLLLTSQKKSAQSYFLTTRLLLFPHNSVFNSCYVFRLNFKARCRTLLSRRSTRKRFSGNSVGFQRAKTIV